MRRLWASITFLAISSAAVIETVDVKKGENITLAVATPEVGKVRRVTLGHCENGTGDIFHYCSPEEMVGGCPVNISERFSILIDTARLCVTILDARASDEGCYIVTVIGERNVRKPRFNVNVNGVSCVPTETPRIDGLISLEHLWIIAGGIAIGIIVVYFIIVVIIINCGCQKNKRNNSDADDNAKDPKDIALSSDMNGGKPGTDESSEMVDETNCLRDNENRRSKKDLNHGA